FAQPRCGRARARSASARSPIGRRRAMLSKRRGGAMRALVFATVALAGFAARAAPPPPATMDAPVMDARREAHIETAGGWILMDADGAALGYAGGTNGVKSDADGLLHVDVRREYYKVVRVGPQSRRSNLQTWLLDCE